MIRYMGSDTQTVNNERSVLLPQCLVYNLARTSRVLPEDLTCGTTPKGVGSPTPHKGLMGTHMPLQHMFARYCWYTRMLTSHCPSPNRDWEDT